MQPRRWGLAAVVATDEEKREGTKDTKVREENTFLATDSNQMNADGDRKRLNF